MPLKSDFDKMTLDELTPIVSMRPGKEYTKDELRAARMAFMEKLGCANPEVDADAEVDYTESAAEEVSVFSVPKEEDDIPLEPLAPVSEPAMEEPAAEPETDEPTPSATAEVPAPSATAELPNPPITEIPEAPSADAVLSEEPEPTPEVAEIAETAPEIQDTKEEETVPSDNEEFILKTESRLAKFLYLLYSFFLLPVLAIESVGLLLACVGTCVSAVDTSYTIIYVLCSSVYALLIGLTWHQFLFRTELGLLLNRTLICVCVLRGFMMLISRTNVLMGIIFIALSALFLVYFIAYDTMFTVSQKKQRVQ